MDISTFIDLAEQYANLGDAVGSQVKRAVEAFDAHGSQEPICESESNPNAFSMYQTSDLLRALSDEGIEGADEFYELVSHELAAMRDARS
jgi:hypothetical protein